MFDLRWASSRALRRWTVRGLVLLFAGGLLGLGLAALAKMARDRVRGWDRYTIAFTDIECVPPPGRERVDFLAEVQYLGDMPSRLRVLDEDLAARLARAFARHPWVEKVERVESVPPRQLQVRLVYRTPVLAVPVAPAEGKRLGGLDRIDRDSANGDDAPVGRTVDRHGILLPLGADSRKLPVWSGRAAPPAGPAGVPWGDPGIEVAAGTLGFLRPYQDGLKVSGIVAEGQELILTTTGGGRILWGRPAGAEAPDEATATHKVERLLEYGTQHGGLGKPGQAWEHDVRPRRQALHRPLAPASEPAKAPAQP